MPQVKESNMNTSFVSAKAIADIRIAFFLVLQVAVLAYFFDPLIESLSIGEYSVLYLIFVMVSFITAVIGWWLYRSGSTKIRYVSLISLASVAAAIFFWPSAQAVACIAPTLGAVVATNVSGVRNSKWIAQGAFGALALCIGALYIAYQPYQVATANVKSQLLDPDSAQFKNLRSLLAFKNVSCGEVNSKNQMGGYTGFSRFIVVEKEVTFLKQEDQIALSVMDENLTKSCTRILYKLGGKEMPSWLK